MAWLESHQTLADHPKTRKLARILGISKPTAIGHLHCLWWWALDYADDGDLSRHDAMDIAIGAEWDDDPETLVKGLTQAGFLDETEDGLQIHDWEDYAGKLINRRRANAKRMQDARAAQTSTPKIGGDDTSGTRATHVHGTQRACVERPDQTGPDQPDKTDKGAAAPNYSAEFEEFWSHFPRGKGNKKKTWDQWKRLRPDADLRAVIVERVEAWKKTRQWRDGFVTHAERWLRDRGWEDDLPEGDAQLRVVNGGKPAGDVIDIPDDLFGQERIDYARRVLAERERRHA